MGEKNTKRTVPELKKFAEKYNVEFSKSTKKPNLVALIFKNVPSEEANGKSLN